VTRGRPAVWSAVFGAPFVAVGAYVYAFQSRYPLLADGPSAPPVAGLPLALFGLFVVGLGLYVRFVDLPDEPTMREGERVVDERHPAQRSALARTAASVPFLAAGVNLLYFTTYPLVYPALALAVGLYLFSTGIHEYWRNTLTTYVLTDRRLMEEYRFVSLVRTEVPLEKVRAVGERRSFVDTLFGLGSVRVRAGASGDLGVTVRSIHESTGFADAIRREMDHGGDGWRGDGDIHADATREDATADRDADRGPDGGPDRRPAVDATRSVGEGPSNSPGVASHDTGAQGDGRTTESVSLRDEQSVDGS
jgi:hypothetical protein